MMVRRQQAPANRRTSQITVNRALLERAVVALRVIAPNSLRDIEDLFPILYPNVHLSYGSIQDVTAEAEKRAAAFNAKQSLEGIDAAALDEMFSQGNPVLAGASPYS